MRGFILGPFLALPSVITAITIIQPFPGTNIDPTGPISIIWTYSASDPPTIDIRIDNADPNSLSTNQILASGVSTSAGSFTIPANTIQNFGTGYQIQATVPGANGNGGADAGKVLATVGGLSLGAGAGNVITASNGQVSFLSATTSVAAAGSATAGGTMAASSKSLGPLGTATATALSGTEAATGAGIGGPTQTVSLSSSTTRSSGFVTSSTTRSGSGTGTVTAGTSSAAETNTASSLGFGLRRRVGDNGGLGFVMALLGGLMGVVAIIV